MGRRSTRIAAAVFFSAALCLASTLDNGNNILCNSDGSKCEDFTSSLDLEALAAVNDWWSEISVKGKVKCMADEVKREEDEALDDKTVPVFRSYECNNIVINERREPIAFRGKVEGYLLQGPGKLRIGNVDVVNDKNVLDDTCFSLNPVFGHMAANITGNFADGKIHGVAKLDMKDGFTFIGTFNKGILHGFCRLWDDKGQLVFVGRVWNGHQNKGIVWNYRESVRIAFRGEALILGDSKKNDLEEDSAIMLTDSGLFMGGDYMRHNDIASDARPVKVKALEKDACILTIKWEQIEGPSMAVRPKNNTLEVSYQGTPVDSMQCNNRDQWNEDNVAPALKKWSSNLWDAINGIDWLSSEVSEDLGANAMELISEIKQVEGQSFTAKLLDGEHVPFKVVQGDIREGVIHGSVRLDFNSKETPKFPLLNQGISIIRGYMKKGVLERTLSIELEDHRVVYSKVRHGVLHGHTVVLGVRHVFPLAKEYEFVSDNIVSEVGLVVNFKDGRPEGLIWQQLVGGGFLHGKLDSNGRFTGTEMAFIYPDMETAMYGTFEDYVMKEGRKSSVMAERCNAYGIKEVRFSEPVGPVMWYSPPTNESYGDGPRNMDPYEEKHMYLANSTIMPWAGEGIFARVDFGADELVCPYSGTIYRNREESRLYAAHYSMNESRSDYERRWSKKYSIGVVYTGSTIEIPIERDYPGTWLPAHGCKINNDFDGRRANSVFAQMEHPRFGYIMSIRTYKPVKAGEEFFVDYGYSGDGPGQFPTDFVWYYEAKKEFLEEQRLKKKEAEEEAKNQTSENTKKKKKTDKDASKKTKKKKKTST